MLGLSMCMGSHPIAHSIPHFTSCSKYTFGTCRQRCPFLLNITHNDVTFVTACPPNECDVVEVLR